MPSPIIFDDGGSTRIKRAVDNGVGAMDGLLDVDGNQNPPQSTATVNGPFNRIQIVTISSDGQPDTPVDSAINLNDSLTITSGNGQSVTATIIAGRRCQIVVQGGPANPPLVEAKQFHGKRRYIVANAGPIQQVSGNADGTVVDVDAAGNLYTTLILS